MSSKHPKRTTSSKYTAFADRLLSRFYLPLTASFLSGKWHSLLGKFPLALTGALCLLSGKWHPFYRASGIYRASFHFLSGKFPLFIGQVSTCPYWHTLLTLTGALRLPLRLPRSACHLLPRSACPCLPLWAGCPHPPGVFTPDPTMLTHRLCCALRALGKGRASQSDLRSSSSLCSSTSLAREVMQDPLSRALLVLLPLLFNFVGKGSDIKERKEPPQSGFARPTPPAVQLRRQRERCKTPSVRPTVVLLPLRFNFVGKGSDAYQTRYRDTNETSVYIGWFVPPLERLERREGAERQGGEFVEAYVAKRTRQISPTRALALDASATSAGSDL